MAVKCFVHFRYCFAFPIERDTNIEWLSVFSWNEKIFSFSVGGAPEKWGCDEECLVVSARRSRPSHDPLTLNAHKKRRVKKEEKVEHREKEGMIQRYLVLRRVGRACSQSIHTCAARTSKKQKKLRADGRETRERKMHGARAKIHWCAITNMQSREILLNARTDCECKHWTWMARWGNTFISSAAPAISTTMTRPSYATIFWLLSIMLCWSLMVEKSTVTFAIQEAEGNTSCIY